MYQCHFCPTFQFWPLFSPFLTLGRHMVGESGRVWLELLPGCGSSVAVRSRARPALPPPDTLAYPIADEWPKWMANSALCLTEFYKGKVRKPVAISCFKARVGLAKGNQIAAKIIVDDTIFTMAGSHGFCEQFSSKYRNTIRVGMLAAKWMEITHLDILYFHREHKIHMYIVVCRWCR